MEKRKNVYIAILTIVVIIVSCMAVYLKVDGDKKAANLQTQIDNQNKVLEEINKQNSLNENDNNISQVEIDKKAKVAIEDYLNLTAMFFYTEEGGLTSDFIGYSYEDYTLIYENDMFKTNIKYDEFITKVEKYMTKELFEKKFLNTKFINSNGYLSVIPGGATGYKIVVNKLKLLSENSGEYEYEVDYQLAKGMTDTIIKVKEVNGSYVVSGAHSNTDYM